MNTNTLFSSLKETISGLEELTITEERKQRLQVLIDYISDKKGKQESINLIFICTHNSRRSHLAQIWAQVFALYFNTTNLTSYSGGTETTQLYPTILETLSTLGFQIKTLSTQENPIYAIKYAKNEHPIIGFSKTYNHSFNPQGNFCAIMTCSQADKGCPFVVGAESRISIPYTDPKEFDNTTIETKKYKERCLEIASEMYYIFKNICQ